MTEEPRTIRQARLAIREADRAVDAVRMSPAAALGGIGPWYLRAAQAKLRGAEREFAKYDDPREEPLKPLSPTVARRASTGERQRRYRCSTCLQEQLWPPSVVERHPRHEKPRAVDGLWTREDCGEWQPVPRLPRGKASA